ncbi:protein scylla [Musca domestica]|uniref:Protein scylla n=1 Tax=Musca domestica TaxID=7370 RepID=A0A9J7I4U5_MUSDO|nr:protein scylla [Musca domestica]
MKMEVLSVQNQYPAHFALATDWKSQLTLSTPTQGGSLKSQPSYKFTTPFKPHHHINHSHQHGNINSNNSSNNNNNNSNSINYNISNNKQQQQHKTNNTSNSSNKLNCDNTTTNTTNNTTTSTALQTAAVQELSLRLLEELRAAKSRHLACTEVSLPCDLTPRIALDILRLAREETHGLRECTIYIEFEDEPNNSRRIATLDLNQQRYGVDAQAYEIYVTLRQDHRGWTSLLPQFMKNLSRTITISPDFSITKHKPYSKSLC